MDADHERRGGWSKGVRAGKYKPELPETVAVETNILGVPTYVLSSRASKSVTQISYNWPLKEGGTASFTFSRTGDNPFPQGQHAMYLDILLAMFANNFSPDGKLHFRFADVLRNAGKPPNNRGAREAIKETIRRYHTCHALWQHSFVGGKHTWSGSLITESTLLEDEAANHVRNPRRGTDHEVWHTVRFHHHIVESMQAGQVRMLYSEMLRCGLPHDAYIVYRHFRRFTDADEIRRSLAQVKAAFNYQGRDDKFKVWLSERLSELVDAGYVKAFTVHATWLALTLVPVARAKLVPWNTIDVQKFSGS